MSLQEKMIEFVKQIEGGDTSVIYEVCHPDIVWINPFGRFEGAEALRQWTDSWNAAAPDTVHEMFNFLEVGDRLAYQMEVIGTSTGPMETAEGTIPPTGAKFVSRGCSWIRWEDGKIVEWRTYFDPDILADMGLADSSATA